MLNILSASEKEQPLGLTSYVFLKTAFKPNILTLFRLRVHLEYSTIYRAKEASSTISHIIYV
jgi:hypothetical protein